MKDIIYLEPDEEITSIIDKLKSATQKKVILVAPKDASIIKSVVNLKILKKEVDSLNIDIAFVTNDIIGRNLISQVNIPIYETIDSAKPIIEPKKEEPNINETIEIDMSEKKPTTPPPGVKVHHYDQNDQVQDKATNNTKNLLNQKKEPVTHTMASPMSAQNYKEPISIKPIKTKKIPWKLIIPLITLIVAGYFVFIYSYVRTNVTLAIKSEKIEEKISMIVDTSINKPTDDNTKIPGEIVKHQEEISKEFEATGKKDIGEKAKGKITIFNGTGTVLDIKANTQFETGNGMVYISTSGVSVPAATAVVDAEGNVVKNPGKADVNVESKEAGDKYNIGPSNFTIDNFPNASASSAESFTGGVTKEITIISSSDLDKSYETLENELAKTTSEKLAENVKNKKLSILSDAIEYDNKKFSSDQEQGTETNKFKATLSMEAKTIAFSEENYKNNVIAALGNKIPQNKELVISKDDQIAQGDYNLDFSKGLLTIDGVITTKLAPKIDFEIIKKELSGKSINDAMAILKSNNDIKDINIQSKPNWYKKISKKIKNITINKNYQNQ